jgi:hypothetical protein
MLAGSALVATQGLGRFYGRAEGFDFSSPEFDAAVEDAQVSTFHEVFLAAAVVMLLAGIVAWGIGRRLRNVEVEPLPPIT